jgi:hypothetical protein
VLSDTAINANNHHLVFLFNIGGISKNEKPLTIQVIPNPANDESRISLTLPVAGKWRLDIMDSRGRLMAGFQKQMNAGDQIFLLSELTGNAIFPGGIYCIRLTGEQGVSTVCKTIFPGR